MSDRAQQPHASEAAAPVELPTFGSDPETRDAVLRHLLSVIRTAARRRKRRPPGSCELCGGMPPAHKLSCPTVKRWPIDAPE